MKSDPDDPNDDAFSATPGADWEDLQGSSEKAKPDLSLRKPDGWLPPKREQWRPQVNQYAPKSKLERTIGYSPRKGGNDGDNPNDRYDIAAAGRLERGRITPKDVASKNGPEDVAVGGRPVEERVVLPPSNATKHSNVNEIVPTGEPGMKLRSQTMPPRSGKRVLKEKPKKGGELRRRFVRGEHGDWGKKKGKGSLAWMSVTGLGVIAIVVAAVVVSHRISKKSGGGGESMFSQLAPIEEESAGSAEDREMLEALTDSQDEAKGIFARYATAKTPADFLDSVYRADENAETIELRWKPLGIKDGWTPGSGAAWTILELDGMRYGALAGSLPDYTRFNAYFRRDGDELKMDWKATSGYGMADFDELKKGQGDGSEIRAWISHVEFYTFALPEGSFRSFRLMSPDGQANLWGYTKVGTELDEKLLALFVPSQITGEAQTDAAVVLGLQPGPDEALPNQWMISKLVRLSWLDE